MKIKLLMMSIFLSLILTGGFASADGSDMPDGMDHQGKMSMEGKKMGRAGGMEMMKAHQQMAIETMAMLRQTMSILQDLNHKPSAEDKELLGKMAGRLDTMMSDSQEMGKRMEERMEKRKKEMQHKN